MKTWLLGAWESLRTSFWFLPAVMALVCTLLAFVTISIDERTQLDLPGPFSRLEAGTADSVRTLLATVVGAIITVLSVVFSITIVTLTLAASQFGPRLLRNFMRDRGNQFVLATMISTFIYCLLVLQMAESADASRQQFVPHLSTMVALLLTLTSLGTLIYFIHHMAQSIQAPFVIGAVANNLHGAIDTYFPDPIDSHDGDPSPEEAADLHRRIENDARPVHSLQQGYIQAILDDVLVAAATRKDVAIRLRHRPGTFVNQNAVLAYVTPADRVDDDLCRRINHAALIGLRRTDTQDIEFEISQLVEIGLRALSPSINDPGTAINCIDQLGGALAHLATRRFPSAYLRDDTGVLRVIVDRTSYTGTVNAAFNQLRQMGQNHPAVTIHMLETIARVAEQVYTDEQRQALVQQAEMIHHSALPFLTEDLDRQSLEKRFTRAMRLLGREP